MVFERAFPQEQARLGPTHPAGEEGKAVDEREEMETLAFEATADLRHEAGLAETCLPDD